MVLKRLDGVTAIVLTYNQKERTLQCLSSLLATEEAPFQVLLWDNGSQDGTAEAVRRAYPHVLVHQHEKNLGVAGGRNAAAALAIDTFQPRYLLFLDNDMLFEPGFVNALRQPLEDNPDVGQTQAKLRFMHDHDRLNDGGGAHIDFVFWQVTPIGYNEFDRGQHDTTKRCIACGGAMMVRAALFQQLGGFDMIFNPFGPEDLDFSLRLQKAGYVALYVPAAVAYHTVSHTYGQGYSETYARNKVRHWYLFMRRHASLPEKAAFYLLGAPLLAFRVMIREIRRGNLGALRGLVRGLIDSLKPPHNN
jgi:O-antigen biosynthesis protein